MENEKGRHKKKRKKRKKYVFHMKYSIYSWQNGLTTELQRYYNGLASYELISYFPHTRFNSKSVLQLTTFWLFLILIHNHLSSWNQHIFYKKTRTKSILLFFSFLIFQPNTKTIRFLTSIHSIRFFTRTPFERSEPSPYLSIFPFFY